MYIWIAHRKEVSNMKRNIDEFLYGLGQISSIVIFMAALIGYWIFQDEIAHWSVFSST